MKRLSDRWMFYCGPLAGIGVGVDDLKHIQNLIDAEEQGLLLRLPCKVGDTVYWLSDFYVFGNNYSVTEEVVEEILIMEDGLLIDMSGVGIKLGHIGKDVFLTKEEAEQKLAEMKGE